MLLSRIGVLALSLGLLEACGSCPPCESKSAKPETCPVTVEGAPPPALPAAAPGPGPVPAASVATPPPASGAPVPAEAPPAGPGGALPEVKVTAVGLHIGGGPNDDASKAPFLRAIEQRFEDFRACYTKVEEPVKGGTFGVDLHIGRDGGRAQVKQPRTGMKGPAFRDCVLKAFEQVEFEKPKKGPTVISYSIRYTLG